MKVDLLKAIPLGPFSLTKPIGKGGMGEVWSGVHSAAKVPIAAKFLTSESARDPDFVRAFRNEIHAIARLQHRGIVRIFDFGQVDAATAQASQGKLIEHTPYLIMERVDGGSLASWKGRLPWRQMRPILLALLDALAHAHARGVVHHDIKPSNILVGKSLHVIKLTDFGLARAARLERAGGDKLGLLEALGTPAYMAPERFDENPRNIGLSSDLYAVGCLGFALATGHPPFGSGKALLHYTRAHLRTPPPLLKGQFQVPPGFEAWLKRLLAKHPTSRFANAADAAWALIGLPDVNAQKHGSPIDAEPAPSEALTRTAVLTPGAPQGEDDNVTDVLSWVELPRDARRAPTSADQPSHNDPPPIPDTWRREKPAPLDIRLMDCGLGLFGLREIPLVGRIEERHQLWKTLIQTASNEVPQAVILRGRGGYGKTRLATWLQERALEVGAAIVLRASCLEPGHLNGLEGMIRRHFNCANLPPKPTRDRIDDLLGRMTGVTDEELDALTALLHPGQQQLAVQLSGMNERFAVLSLLIERLANERTVLIALDDIHCDETARRFVQHIVENLEQKSLRVLFVLTAQDEDVDGVSTMAQLKPLLKLKGTTDVPVGPLGKAERAVLMRELLGLEPRLATRLAEGSGGNPLFAIRVVEGWIRAGVLQAGPRGFELADSHTALPDGLGAVWTERLEALLERLTPEAQENLEKAAVLGTEFSRARWHLTCQLSGKTASDRTLEKAIECRVLRPHDDVSTQLVFVHPMLRGLLLQNAKRKGQLAGHHSACADAVAQADSNDRFERQGRHLVEAGRFDDALDPLVEAAKLATDSGDYARGSSLLSAYQQALDALQAHPMDMRRARLYGYLLAIEQRQGLWRDAYARGVDLLERGKKHGVREVQLEALVGLAFTTRSLGKQEEAWEYTQQALTLGDQVDDTRLEAEVVRIAGCLHMDRGNWNDAKALLAESVELADKVQEARKGALAQIWLSGVYLRLGEFDEAERIALDAQARYAALGSRSGLADVAINLGELARCRGELERAEGWYREALSRYRAAGVADAVVPYCNLGLTLIERGKYAEAGSYLREALEQLSSQGRMALTGVVHAFILPSTAEAGDWPSFDNHLKLADELLEGGGYLDPDTARLAALGGDLAARAGETARAEAAWAFAAQHYLALGDTAKAEALEARNRTN